MVTAVCLVVLDMSRRINAKYFLQRRLCSLTAAFHAGLGVTTGVWRARSEHSVAVFLLETGGYCASRFHSVCVACVASESMEWWENLDASALYRRFQAPVSSCFLRFILRKPCDVNKKL